MPRILKITLITLVLLGVDFVVALLALVSSTSCPTLTERVFLGLACAWFLWQPFLFWRFLPELLFFFAIIGVSFGVLAHFDLWIPQYGTPIFAGFALGAYQKDGGNGRLYCYRHSNYTWELIWRVPLVEEDMLATSRGLGLVALRHRSNIPGEFYRSPAYWWKPKVKVNSLLFHSKSVDPNPNRYAVWDPETGMYYLWGQYDDDGLF